MSARKAKMTAEELLRLWQDHATAALLAEQFMRGISYQAYGEEADRDDGRES